MYRYYKFISYSKNFKNFRIPSPHSSQENLLQLFHDSERTTKSENTASNSNTNTRGIGISMESSESSPSSSPVTTHHRSRRETLSPKTAKEMLKTTFAEEENNETDGIDINEDSHVSSTRNKSRRQTLSPKTAKEMLILSLDEEEAENNNNNNSSIDTFQKQTNHKLLLKPIKSRRETLSPKTAKEMLVLSLDDNTSDFTTDSNSSSCCVSPTENSISTSVSTRMRSRRQTLSPKSAKEMIFMVDDDEINSSNTTSTSLVRNQSNNNNNNIEVEVLPPTSSPTEVEYGFLTMQEESVEDQIILEQFNTELTALLADEDIPCVVLNHNNNNNMTPSTPLPVPISEKKVSPLSPSVNTPSAVSQQSPVPDMSLTPAEKEKVSISPQAQVPLKCKSPVQSSSAQKSTMNLSVADSNIDNSTTNINSSSTTTNSTIIQKMSSSTLSVINCFDHVSTISTDAALFFNSKPNSPAKPAAASFATTNNTIATTSSSNTTTTATNNMVTIDDVPMLAFATETVTTNSIPTTTTTETLIYDNQSLALSYNSLDRKLLNLPFTNNSQINSPKSETPTPSNFLIQENNNNNNITNTNEIPQTKSHTNTSTSLNQEFETIADTDTEEEEEEESNEEEKESIALAKLYARFDIAKWKYHYEIALIQVMVEAKRRLKK